MPCLSLQWFYNGLDSVSNHQHHDCLLKSLFRRRSKKTSALRVTGLCAGNSPETGEFLAQRASNAENVSILDAIMMLGNWEIISVCSKVSTITPLLIVEYPPRLSIGPYSIVGWAVLQIMREDFISVTRLLLADTCTFMKNTDLATIAVHQGSCWVWTQPMKDDVIMWCILLAGPLPRMILLDPSNA